MERGRILYFNPDKGFGFIEVPGKKDLFAHMGDMRVATYVEDSSGEPRLCGRYKPSRWVKMPPVEGDWVMYEIDQSGDGRPKAKPWELAEAYDAAKAKSSLLAGHPKTKMPFELALKYLVECHFNCLRDHTFGDEEFNWYRNDTRVATGYYGRGKYTVSIQETELYHGAHFSGEQARKLYDRGGKTERHDRNDIWNGREEDHDDNFFDLD